MEDEMVRTKLSDYIGKKVKEIKTERKGFGYEYVIIKFAGGKEIQVKWEDMYDKDGNRFDQDDIK